MKLAVFNLDSHHTQYKMADITDRVFNAVMLHVGIAFNHGINGIKQVADAQNAKYPLPARVKVIFVVLIVFKVIGV